MIELKDVAKRFRITPGPGRKAGVVEALAGVTATIEAGEIVAVVGPNGAGKSTLFSILLGFLEPTAGDVFIDELDPRAYIRANGAGYLPERFRLPGEWNVRDALRAFARLERIDVKRADAIIDLLGLNEHARKSIATLSHGMVQRVGLAQALMGERALVVLDEPTEGLDAVWRVRFRDVIAGLRARQSTVLIASHDLSELERLADRAIVLQDGRVSDTVALRDRGGSRAFRIELMSAYEGFNDLFPGAEPVSGSSTYVVNVSDVADLNRRLAALLSSGVNVVSIQPAETLEDRVTRGGVKS